jgi:hypothetical protein
MEARCDIYGTCMECTCLYIYMERSQQFRFWSARINDRISESPSESYITLGLYLSYSLSSLTPLSLSLSLSLARLWSIENSLFREGTQTSVKIFLEGVLCIQWHCADSFYGAARARTARIKARNKTARGHSRIKSRGINYYAAAPEARRVTPAGFSECHDDIGIGTPGNDGFPATPTHRSSDERRTDSWTTATGSGLTTATDQRLRQSSTIGNFLRFGSPPFLPPFYFFLFFLTYPTPNETMRLRLLLSQTYNCLFLCESPHCFNIILFFLFPLFLSLYFSSSSSSSSSLLSVLCYPK